MSKVQITNQGIKRTLSKISGEEAVAEFVWNSFDAQATRVEVSFDSGAAPFYPTTELRVIDNGNGIPSEQLEKKFTPFLDSEKAIKGKEENVGLQGKHGYGRFTFFKFAAKAVWKTMYKTAKGVNGYNITIESKALDDFTATRPEPVKGEAGTTVTFTGVKTDFHLPYFEKRLKPYLVNEFAWYLEVNKDRDVQLTLKGERLAYEHLIADEDKFERRIDKDETRKEQWVFQCTYVQWKNRLNDEYSRFYFLNEDGKLKGKKNTKLNKKGDNFFHSIIIKSDFFEHFVFDQEDIGDGDKRLILFSEAADYRVFKMLGDQMDYYLRKKRKPFLHQSADLLVRAFQKERVMPAFGNNPWDKLRKTQLETLVKGLYEAEPALFAQLNTEQKKTFLHLMNLALDSDERDNLFSILENVVDMDAEDRATLANVLKTTRLTHVTQALKLVHERLKAVAMMKELVFNHSLQANERDHLQKVMEAHYWILGEEYSLVCAAEAKFETALRSYLYKLRGDVAPVSIDHPDKQKEMDIFLVRQQWGAERVNNVVAEIKSPTTVKMLTDKQLNQIKTYMKVIFSIDAFNAQTNCTWDFYLIGQDYDSSIENEKKNAQHHGEKDLVFKVENYKIYVKRWSEVFIDVELRLKWLNEKLRIERDKLVTVPASAAEAVGNLQGSAAGQAVAGVPAGEMEV